VLAAKKGNDLATFVEARLGKPSHLLEGDKLKQFLAQVQCAYARVNACSAVMLPCCVAPATHCTCTHDILRAVLGAAWCS